MPKTSRADRAFRRHAVLLVLAGAFSAAQAADWPVYPNNPFVIRLRGMASGLDPQDKTRPGGEGGLIVYDLNNDGRLDYVLTRPGQIGAYDHDGAALWVAAAEIRLTSKSESEGLPGLHAPGVQAGDPDGDGQADVLYLARNGELHWLDGRTGQTRRRQSLAQPYPAASPWEHLVLCNLRGKGDRDLLVQATSSEKFRLGRYVAAFALDGPAPALLWSTSKYLGCGHNGLRAVDLDGDGLDEVVGATIFRPDGRIVPWTRVRPRLYGWAHELFGHYRAGRLFGFPHYQGHLDSIFVDDVRPDLPNLEIVALQEGQGMKTFLYNLDGLIWENDLEQQEPQNAALGEFDSSRPGLEIWCRSRHDEDQKPWVYSSTGAVIARWDMARTAPPDWTRAGIEEIYSIHWDGGPKQFLAAKERHEEGDVAVIDAMTGRFVRRFPEAANRLHVADVSGDWREEIMVVTDQEIRVYANSDPLPESARGRARLWTLPSYRRAKMTYNYYSP
jgi:hypothetical protein